jgi:hypothetical protein
MPFAFAVCIVAETTVNGDLDDAVADAGMKTRKPGAFITAHKLGEAGAPALAPNNPPWTLWFVLRNEVLLEVE